MSFGEKVGDIPSERRGSHEREGSAVCARSGMCTVRCPTGGKLRGKGFSARHPETQKILRGLSVKAPKTMVVIALLYLAQIAVTSWLLMETARASGFLWTGLAYACGAVWIARTMRALECMTHEFGHGVIRRRARNDLVGNLLAAFPLGLSVGAMRESHNSPHHTHLGEVGVDPDRRRYTELRTTELDRSSIVSFASGLACRLPAYNAGWIAALGLASGRFLAFLLWHCAVVASLSLLTSMPWTRAVEAWTALWLVPMVLVLPVIRFIGEAGKHVYEAGETVTAVTVSNIGLIHRAIIHPFGDGYHTVHHLFANIPGFRQRLAHEWLLANEPDYADGLRFRTRILEEPKRRLVGGRS